MQEMNAQQVDAVSGGLSADAGGVAITMLGVTAAVVGSPVLAVVGVGLGVGILIANAF